MTDAENGRKGARCRVEDIGDVRGHAQNVDAPAGPMLSHVMPFADQMLIVGLVRGTPYLQQCFDEEYDCRVKGIDRCDRLGERVSARR